MSNFLDGLVADVKSSAAAYAVGSLSGTPKTVASDGSQHTAGQAQPVTAVGGAAGVTATPVAKDNTMMIVGGVILAILAVVVVVAVARK